MKLNDCEIDYQSDLVLRTVSLILTEAERLKLITVFRIAESKEMIILKKFLIYFFKKDNFLYYKF